MLTRFKRRQRQQPFHYTQNQTKSLTYPAYSDGGNTKWRSFVHCLAPLIALFGGNRSGKTHQNIYRQQKKRRAHPPLIMWAAINTWDMVGETLWKKYKEILHPSEYYEPVWKNSRKEIPAFVKFRDGSELYFKTYESGRKVFQSAKVDDIVLSEEPEDHQIIIECMARTGDSGGQVCLDMTPLLGKTWPYYHIDQANEPGLIESWRVSLFENPFVSDQYKQNLVKLYGKDEIDRRIYGLFTILEGAILKEFDETVHVLRDFPVIPTDWRRIRSIDLGARNPFTCGWYALSPDGIFYKYDEYYNENKGRNTDCETHAYNIRMQEREQIETGKVQYRQFPAENTQQIEASICDWELQTRIELEKYGIITIAALKDKQRSWEVANRALKQRPPVIQIAPWCVNTIREIPGYHYKKVREGNEVKEVEAKIDDHTVDDFLYALMYFWGGGDWDPNMIQGD